MMQNFTSNETLKSQQKNSMQLLDFNDKRTFELIKNSLDSDLMAPKQSTIDKILLYVRK